MPKGLWQHLAIDCSPGGCPPTGRKNDLEQVAVIQPIGPEQQRQVEQRTEDFRQRAQQIYSRRFDRVPVLFDLKGRSAGMFKVIGKRRLIRYNPWIFAKYFEENLRDTFPPVLGACTKRPSPTYMPA